MLADQRETQSLTPVTVGSRSLEMQTGPVSLMDSGQGLSQSVLVCSILQCNVRTLKYLLYSMAHFAIQ